MNEIVLIISTFIALSSLIVSLVAVLICVTQHVWKKRDGVLLITIFFVDVIFSCVVGSTNMVFLHCDRFGTTSHVLLSNLFVFIFLMSWGCQSLIAVNRYVVITFPFVYKKLLNKRRLCAMVAVVCLLCTVGCTLCAALYHKHHHNYCSDISSTSKGQASLCKTHEMTYQFVFAHLSGQAVAVVVSLHLLFLVVIFVMECYLWKIARGHQNRYRSVTQSVTMKKEADLQQQQQHHQNSDIDSSNNQLPTSSSLGQKRLSITQSLQKRLSFSTTQRMAVRRTPFLLLGLHFCTIVPYCVLSVVYTTRSHNLLQSHGSFSYLCIFLLIANSVRPTINVFHHISSNKMKKFKLFLQMLVRHKSEHCTDYYIENRKEVETIFRLRRESAHSIVTEGSIV